MKISLSWLDDFLATGLDTPALDDTLTATGLKVEAIESAGVSIQNLVVAKILESLPHPDADRLSVCQVDDGSGSPRQIVCGAKNYKVGDKIPLALPGAVLPGNFKIKPGKLRGIKSEGMMCSGKEIGLGADSAGLLILPPDSPIGHPISELFPSETVIELEITPNRPDWLSHYGVARELGAFLQKPVSFSPPPLPPTIEDSSLASCETPVCPFYSLRKITGVKVKQSPEKIRRRLESIGLRAINNVVDITNYVLHELGQPLHAFDAAKVSGPICARQARDGEEFLALDGKTYRLTPEDTVIADSAQVLALAGIMGGSTSGVTETTTDVLLESALFLPQAIRKTSRRLALQSDSSYRFERGIDPGMVLVAAAQAANQIADIAEGIPAPSSCTTGALPAKSATVSLRHAKCEALLGTSLSPTEIASALRRVGMTQLSENEGVTEWQPPSFRHDLTREVDLVEEVARIIGIDKIPSRAASLAAPQSPADAAYDFQNLLREKLVASGFCEAKLSTLVSASQLGEKENSAIRLKNPLGEDQSFLRPSLLPGMLQAAQRNFHAGTKDVRIFELGSVYSNTGTEQQGSLGLLASGPARETNWLEKKPADFTFFDLKAVLQSLFPSLLRFENTEKKNLVVASLILCGEIEVGFAGILEPAAARLLDATAEILVAEISWPALQSTQTKNTGKFSPIPKFPSTSRDLALILPEAVPYATVESILLACNEPLLASFAPFDLFRDPEGIRLPANKKSLAISLTFRSSERTLASSEIDAATEKIRVLLKQNLPVEFRE